MKSVSKALSLFFHILIYILIGFFLRFLSIFTKEKFYYFTITKWTKFITGQFNKIMGIKVFMEGNLTSLKEKGNLVICNHVSYIDGLVLASIFGVVFVSKKEVRSWPLFGQLALAGATVFVDRQNKRKALYSLKKMAEILRTGVNLLLFPEGTSTNGKGILSFQSIFFEAALMAKNDIVPVTIQYLKVNSEKISYLNCDKVFWYGQIKFFKHLLEVLKLKSIEVKVFIHPKVAVKEFINLADGRKNLSQLCREIILSVFSPVA